MSKDNVVYLRYNPLIQYLKTRRRENYFIALAIAFIEK